MSPGTVRLAVLGAALVLVACGKSSDDGTSSAEASESSAGTCSDGCPPDFGGGESSTSTGTTSTSGEESSSSTDTSASSSESGTTGGDACPGDPPIDQPCSGQLACDYGDTCCLCDPEMGCDAWQCAPPFGGVFCPEEHPGVGSDCPMEAISCSWCVPDSPALMCTGGVWTPMLWCF